MPKKFSIQKVHSFERLRIITIKWIYPKSQNDCNWSSSLVSNQISFFSKYSIFKHLHVFFLLLFISFSDQKLSFSNITPLFLSLSARFLIFPTWNEPSCTEGCSKLKWAPFAMVLLGLFLIVKWTKNQIFLALPSNWIKTTTKNCSVPPNTTEIGWYYNSVFIKYWKLIFGKSPRFSPTNICEGLRCSRNRVWFASKNLPPRRMH